MVQQIVDFPVKKREANKPHALILGVNGTIGNAISKQLFATHSIVGVARDIHNASHLTTLVQSDYDEVHLPELVNTLRNITDTYDLIINCIGTLHGDGLFPEKRLLEITKKQLTEYFAVNSILPAVLIKYLAPLMPRKQRCVYANLSAMIGSIGDNHIGGWYGYRASKAALNMIVKTASIELARTHPKLAIVAIHPGTTKSKLSEPFTDKVDPDNLYTPQLTATRLVHVLSTLSAKDTGGFFKWDGSKIEW